MKVYKITKVDDGQSFYTKLVEIESLFDGSEPGEAYLISHEEMSEEDYERLPEFGGF